MFFRGIQNSPKPRVYRGLIENEKAAVGYAR
jgi:hypothetical protein